MRVTFLKDHEPYAAGQEEEVSDDLANYWVKVGVAKISKEKKVVNIKKEIKQPSVKVKKKPGSH